MDDRTKSNKGDGSASVWCLVLMMTIDRSPSPKKEKREEAPMTAHAEQREGRDGAVTRKYRLGARNIPSLASFRIPPRTGKSGEKSHFSSHNRIEVATGSICSSTSAL